MTMIILAVEDEFLDVVGDPWSRPTPNGIEALDLRGVLKLTVRQCPVKKGEDAERTLDIINALRDPDEGPIRMRKDDFDWMVAHFREMAHTVWKAPDAAFLVRLLNEMVSITEPIEQAE